MSVGGKVNWHSLYGKQYAGSSERLKREIPYGPATPLLGIYLKKMKTQTWKDIYATLCSALQQPGHESNLSINQ